MIIVSKTSPISNLAKVGQLDLLQKLYQTILIPNAVYRELLDKRAGETVIAVCSWMRYSDPGLMHKVEGRRQR